MCPTINRIPKRERKEQPQELSEHKILRKQGYATTAWKKTRLVYLKQHPLCEECLKKGKVTPATSVHHLRTPFDYATNTINQYLLLDDKNLEAVCHTCHQEIHNGGIKKSPEEIIEALDALFAEIPD